MCQWQKFHNFLQCPFMWPSAGWTHTHPERETERVRVRQTDRQADRSYTYTDAHTHLYIPKINAVMCVCLSIYLERVKALTLESQVKHDWVLTVSTWDGWCYTLGFATNLRVLQGQFCAHLCKSPLNKTINQGPLCACIHSKKIIIIKNHILVDPVVHVTFCQSSLRIHAKVSLFESGEQRYIKIINNIY